MQGAMAAAGSRTQSQRRKKTNPAAKTVLVLVLGNKHERCRISTNFAYAFLALKTVRQHEGSISHVFRFI